MPLFYMDKLYSACAPFARKDYAKHAHNTGQSDAQPGRWPDRNKTPNPCLPTPAHITLQFGASLTSLCLPGSPAKSTIHYDTHRRFGSQSTGPVHRPVEKPVDTTPFVTKIREPRTMHQF